MADPWCENSRLKPIDTQQIALSAMFAVLLSQLTETRAVRILVKNTQNAESAEPAIIKNAGIPIIAGGFLNVLR